jgi:hypothetical protein
MRTILLIAAIL